MHLSHRIPSFATPWRILPALLLTLALLVTNSTPSFAAYSHRTVHLTPQPAERYLSASANSVAAIVNGHSLPMSDFNLLLNATRHQRSGQSDAGLRATVMNQLVANELIREYAAAHGIQAASDVNNRLRYDQHAYGGLKSLRGHLAKQGLTLASYKQLLTYFFLGQKVEQQIAPLMTGPQPMVRVRHVLISLHPAGKPARSIAAARTRAMEVLTQLQHGSSFAALARQYSDDPATAGKGGILGAIYHNQTMPPIVDQIGPAAFKLPVSRAALLYTAYGWDVVKVLSRGTSVAPLMVQRQVQAQMFTSWLVNQIKHASIKRIAVAF